MGECRSCPKERRIAAERPYKSVPRKTKYSSQTTHKSYKPYRGNAGDCCTVKNCNTCGPSLGKPNFGSPGLDPYLERNPRCSPCAEPFLEPPGRCNPCIDPCLERTKRYGPCLDPYLDWPGQCNPCLDPYSGRRGRCSPCDPCNYYPENTDSGLLCAIRNKFTSMFTGRKRNCAPLYKGKMYNYSSTQLKYMERQLDKLEDEASCLESAIKEAFECGMQVSCTNLRRSLTALAERLESLRSDLSCAYDCYDPCRDKCEFDLICYLLERVHCLDVLLNDLYLQLECLEYQASCEPRRFKPGCRKPACCKPRCLPTCQKPSCVPRQRCGSCKPNLCRKSSVIPLGVMLVKL